MKIPLSLHFIPFVGSHDAYCKQTENFTRFGIENSSIRGTRNCGRKHNLLIQLRITSGRMERDESAKHAILVFCLTRQPKQHIRQQTIATNICTYYQWIKFHVSKIFNLFFSELNSYIQNFHSQQSEQNYCKCQNPAHSQYRNFCHYAQSVALFLQIFVTRIANTNLAHFHSSAKLRSEKYYYVPAM